MLADNCPRGLGYQELMRRAAQVEVSQRNSLHLRLTIHQSLSNEVMKKHLACAVQVRQLLNACDDCDRPLMPQSRPSEHPAQDTVMDIDSVRAQTDSPATAATESYRTADNATGAPAADSMMQDAAPVPDEHHAAGVAAARRFAGLVLGKLAVRGHARLVARALWQTMRLHMAPGSQHAASEDGRERHSSKLRAAGSAMAADVPTWGDATSLGTAGTSVPCLTHLRYPVFAWNVEQSMGPSSPYHRADPVT